VCVRVSAQGEECRFIQFKWCINEDASYTYRQHEERKRENIPAGADLQTHKLQMEDAEVIAKRREW
jgi:hypothetical protein